MDSELLKIINKRKKKMFGGQQQPPTSVQTANKKPGVIHAEGFGKNRQMLEMFFAQKNQPVSLLEINKQQIKGDRKSFENAKALLEQQFGKKQPSNALNVSPGVRQLPPPPSFDLLPPLPPPPSFDLLPPLPPLPPLPINNIPLPPPLSIPINNLPLPSPPPLFPISNIPLPPPPPPPPLSSLPVNNIHLPLPPHSPSFKKDNPNNLISKSPAIKKTQCQNDLPSDPNRLKMLQNVSRQGHQINILSPSPSPTLNKNGQISQRCANDIRNPSANIDGDCFILSNNNSKMINKAPNNCNKRNNIFGEKISQNKKMAEFKKVFGVTNSYNLTKQIFGKDISNLIKKQFIKSANILYFIDFKIQKKAIYIDFPSIENRCRNIYPIQTIYADSDFLDLAGSYSACKNYNFIKNYNEKRQKFIDSLNYYCWESDPLKLNPLKDLIKKVPSTYFEIPNFVGIKNTLNRAQNLMRAFINNQQFQKCQQLKKLKQSIENHLQYYCQKPDQNKHLLKQVYSLAEEIKNMNF